MVGLLLGLLEGEQVESLIMPTELVVRTSS